MSKYIRRALLILCLPLIVFTALIMTFVLWVIAPEEKEVFKSGVEALFIDSWRKA